jgi:hypothetical protein
MSYSFQPLTDEELDSYGLMESGIYNFEVNKATRKTSKNGNPMCELQLTVWDNSGKTYYLFDYLVFSSVNLNIKKLSHFCKSVGLHEEYKKGQIPEELQGLSGSVEIGIQESQPKPNGGYYPSKNVVIDYIVGDSSKTTKPDNDNFINDELPF